MFVVTCALLGYPPVTPAFAYRFDSRDRSIVISGDTKRSDALIRLAEGADVLVQEVFSASAVNRLLAPLPNATALKKSILSHHTSVEDWSCYPDWDASPTSHRRNRCGSK